MNGWRRVLACAALLLLTKGAGAVGGDERVAIRATISIRSDQSTFYTEIDLKVTLNEAEFFQKSWQEAIRRELT